MDSTCRDILRQVLEELEEAVPILLAAPHRTTTVAIYKLQHALALVRALVGVALLAALLPATAFAQQPWGRSYVPPPPPAYRGTLPSWAPPTLPPGSPSLMIPMPAPTPPPAPWPGYRP